MHDCQLKLNPDTIETMLLGGESARLGGILSGLDVVTSVT